MAMTFLKINSNINTKGKVKNVINFGDAVDSYKLPQENDPLAAMKELLEAISNELGIFKEQIKGHKFEAMPQYCLIGRTWPGDVRSQLRKTLERKETRRQAAMLCKYMVEI